MASKGEVRPQVHGNKCPSGQSEVRRTAQVSDLGQGPFAFWPLACF